MDQHLKNQSQPFNSRRWAQGGFFVSKFWIRHWNHALWPWLFTLNHQLCTEKSLLQLYQLEENSEPENHLNDEPPVTGTITRTFGRLDTQSEGVALSWTIGTWPVFVNKYFSPDFRWAIVTMDAEQILPWAPRNSPIGRCEWTRQNILQDAMGNPHQQT